MPKRNCNHATPTKLAEALFVKLDAGILPKPPKRILEPCAGAGHLVRAIRAHWPAAEVTGVEIADVCEINADGEWSPVSVYRADFLRSRWGKSKFDLVVANPPWNQVPWHAFVLASLDLAPVVAVLGPAANLCRKRFNAHLRFWPCDYFPISPRPSFTADGKEGRSDVAWYVFHERSERRWETLVLNP